VPAVQRLVRRGDVGQRVRLAHRHPQASGVDQAGQLRRQLDGVTQKVVTDKLRAWAEEHVAEVREARQQFDFAAG